MQSKDAFSSYHPIVNFLYFCLVIGFSMFFMHPVCLFVSFLGAFVYYIKLKGIKKFLGMLKFSIPIVLVAMVINPLFNHQGINILFYLPSGNPMTLESIVYGLASAVMVFNMLLWFGIYSDVMTSDKFIYLFGRVIPSLSLVLSMTLRFVPRFKDQFNKVKQAQSLVGKSTEKGKLFEKIKNIFSCFSVMVTWSLENAIETADSMKSRGYGLKGRTAYSIYSFTLRDKVAITVMTVMGISLITGGALGAFKWLYFPIMQGESEISITLIFSLIYLVLCLIPVFIDLREERKWRLLKSKI